MKKMTLVQALNDFFTPPKIAIAEMKALLPADREYFKSLLEETKQYEIISATVIQPR